ncbi:MAG: hypothetical protein ACE361_25600 [Aureliella sp.]
MVAGDNADLLAVDVKNRFDLAGLVELEQVAFTASRDDSFARGDATGRNFDEVNDVLRMADSDDSPLDSGFSWIPSPKNLRGSLRLRFKNEAGRERCVGILVPGLLDVDQGCHDAVEHDSADFVFRNRLDRDANSTCGTICSWLSNFDRGIAYESCKFNRSFEWISKRSLETADSTDRNCFVSDVVNADGRRVLHMRPGTTATG